MELAITSCATLNNGVEMPLLGLGVYQSGKGQKTENAVTWALEAGYRHIDTAALYGNEQEVGEAIRTSTVKRSEIFVTTKLWNSDHGYDSTLEAFEKSLRRLRIDYIDLYLVHWPVKNLRLETWRAMEEILASGKCRAIGVSNYMVHHLEELLADCEIKPAVNQFELSPYLYRKDVVNLCRKHDIQVEGYSPLTKGEKLHAQELIEIARHYRKTTAQILIRWNLQNNFVVIPKSVKKTRIEENCRVFDFSLSDEDVERLNTFNENYTTSWDPTDAP